MIRRKRRWAFSRDIFSRLTERKSRARDRESSKHKGHHVGEHR